MKSFHSLKGGAHMFYHLAIEWGGAKSFGPAISPFCRGGGSIVTSTLQGTWGFLRDRDKATLSFLKFDMYHQDTPPLSRVPSLNVLPYGMRQHISQRS